jgi:hypothetical protein
MVADFPLIIYFVLHITRKLFPFQTTKKKNLNDSKDVNNKKLNKAKSVFNKNSTESKVQSMSLSQLDHQNQASVSDDHETMMQVLKRYLHQNNLSLYCF